MCIPGADKNGATSRLHSYCPSSSPTTTFLATDLAPGLHETTHYSSDIDIVLDLTFGAASPKPSSVPGVSGSGGPRHLHESSIRNPGFCCPRATSTDSSPDYRFPFDSSADPSPVKPHLYDCANSITSRNSISQSPRRRSYVTATGQCSMDPPQQHADNGSPFGPFGYSFEADHDPEPEVPDGIFGNGSIHVLSENDDQLLMNFFGIVNGNPLQTFGETLGSGTESHLIHDVPPDLMGTSTSLSQLATSLHSPTAHQPLHPHENYNFPVPPAALSPHHAMPPPPTPGAVVPGSPAQPQGQQPLSFASPYAASHHSNATEDVLSAAATLMQNHTSNRNRSFGSQGASSPYRTTAPPVAQVRHQLPEEFQQESRMRNASLSAASDSNLFTHMMWGSDGQQQPQHLPQQGSQYPHPVPRNAPIPPFQWGSDSSFTSPQGSTPGPFKGGARFSQEQLQPSTAILQSLTQYDTPTHNISDHRNGQAQQNLTQNGQSCLEDGSAVKREDAADRPNKRRKSKLKAEFQIPIELNMTKADKDTPKPSRRRKSRQSESNASASSSIGTAGTARGSKAAAAEPKNGASKAQRENLTEAQRRENHIKSEQKRRGTIKQGFDDLYDIVPNLSTGHFSRSGALEQSHVWLGHLLKGNAILAAQLAELEGAEQKSERSDD